MPGSRKKFQQSVETAISEFAEEARKTRLWRNPQLRLRDAVMDALDVFSPPPKRKPKKKPQDWVAGLDDAVTERTVADKRRSLPHLHLKIRRVRERCSIRFGDKLMATCVRDADDVEQGQFFWKIAPSRLGKLWGMEKGKAKAEHKDAREVSDYANDAMRAALRDPSPALKRWLDIYGLDVTPDLVLLRKPETGILR